MSEWERDKARTDPYLPYIKRILGQYLISDAPIDEDRERNTDLIVLTLKPYRIGVRLRGWNYHARYGNQFTIRSSRPSGAKTEFEKIMDSWGDYFFYGFMHPHSERYRVVEWTLGDLNAFRDWVRSYGIEHNGQIPAAGQQNGEAGGSGFLAFNLYDPKNGLPCVPDRFVVAKHREREEVSGSLL
jgi:hypothetical protein